MTIQYPHILSLRTQAGTRSWSDRDAILYALGLGFGTATHELQYVYEKKQLVVPTFAVILQRGLGLSVEELGIDYRRLVHGGQEIFLNRPLEVSGSVKGEGRVVAVYDKGDKGAIVVLDTELRDTRTDEIVATCRTTLFARGDGNCGAPRQGGAVAENMPDRAADASAVLDVAGNQALIYRLCGDLNPLHVDPDVARSAGFDRPILHGLSTFGMAARALTHAFDDIDLRDLRRLGARFSAPVFPGDEITFDFWRNERSVAFQGRVIARDAVVLKSGKAEFVQR